VVAPDAERFDRLAPTYDRAVPFFAETARRFVEWAGVAPGQRVLDLGSGRGAVSIALAESYGIEVEIVAGDVSEEMLSRLRALRLPGVDVKYIDATAIDEPDGSFDVVFCAFVLHFLAGRAQALAEVARVLRAGGVWNAGRVVGEVQLNRRRLSL
jgi:ubiquinone/menaquinone biosynthesis C-methylase UbiE